MPTIPDFDPYHKWLGISPDEQPPNHYRLLGISEFEANANLIEEAYDKAMLIVKQEEHGEHLGYVEPVAADLFRAKECLINSDDKGEYDAALREKSTPQSHKAAARQEDEERTDTRKTEDAIQPLPQDSSDSPRRTLRAVGVVLVIVVVVGAICLAVVWEPGLSVFTEPNVGTRAGQV